MPLQDILKKKPLPDGPIAEQITLLMHPEQNSTAYEPFVGADLFAFEPHANTPSRVNAWWLTEAAWLAYRQSEADIKQVYLSRTGLEATLETEGGTDCTVASNDAFAIVAFRGTQSGAWDDVLSDSRWTPKPWDVGRVHTGFAEALERIWPKLEKRLAALKPGCRVWFTGHSLGAALATLAGVRVKSAQGVYTCGSPLVGDQVFTGTFNAQFGERSLRYVNDHDLVTRVPPEELGFPGRYAHVDAVRWIDSGGTIGSATPSTPRFFANVIGQSSFVLHLVKNFQAFNIPFPSLPDGLRDHTPLQYVIHVWNDFVAHAVAAGGPG